MNTKPIHAAFEPELAVLPLVSLLPTKRATDLERRSPRYRSIEGSLKEVGLVEPLVVYHKADHRGRHLLLDGNLRRLILMEMGQTEAECILAKDDEAFTYNKRLNRLATVQEHFMIVRAIERGISEEKLARALNVKVNQIKRRRTLLRGVCTEAVDLLDDKPVNPVVFDLLRKMRPSRQLEACQLMVSAATYTSAYAKALLVATHDDELVRRRKRPAPPIVTSADLALMERELKSAQEDFKAAEASYGSDMLDLVIATAYIAKLLSNSRLVSYLDENHPEIFTEFNKIVSVVAPGNTHNEKADALPR